MLIVPYCLLPPPPPPHNKHVPMLASCCTHREINVLHINDHRASEQPGAHPANLEPSQCVLVAHLGRCLLQVVLFSLLPILLSTAVEVFHVEVLDMPPPQLSRSTAPAVHACKCSSKHSQPGRSMRVVHQLIRRRWRRRVAASSCLGSLVPFELIGSPASLTL